MKWVDRASRFFLHRLDADTFLGLDLTLGLVVAAGAIWLCGALIDAVLDNATMVRWDVATDALIHAHVTTAGLSAFQVISELGSPTSMTVLCIAGAILLLRDRRVTLLITWIAAFAGSGILGRVLKAAVGRGRPTFGVAYLTDASYSFPSGHAIGSFTGVVMLILVIRSLRLLGSRWLLALETLGAIFVLLVGVSRVYLGVHFPSDVLGGFAVAAGWTALCIIVAGIVLNRRGRTLTSRPPGPHDRDVSA